MCIRKIFNKLFKKAPTFRNKQKEMLINSMSALISVEMSKRLKAIEGNGEDNKRFHYTEETLAALKDLAELLSKKFICAGTNLGGYKSSAQLIFKNLLKNTVADMYSFDIADVARKCASQLFNGGFRPRYYVYEDYFGEIIDVNVNAVVDKAVNQTDASTAAPHSEQTVEPAKKPRRSRKKKAKEEVNVNGENTTAPKEAPGEEILDYHDSQEEEFVQTEMNYEDIYEERPEEEQ